MTQKAVRRTSFDVLVGWIDYSSSHLVVGGTSRRDTPWHAYLDEVGANARSGDDVPVDGVDEAQRRILFNVHRAALDVGKRGQAEVLQLYHLVDDERVVEEKSLAANDGQIGEQVAQRAHAVGPVQQQVAGDLAQFRVRQIVPRLRVDVDQQDLNETFDHYAVVQLARERFHVVADVDARTDCVTNLTKEKPQQIIKTFISINL